MNLDIWIVYNDDEQLELLKKESFSDSPFFNLVDERTFEGKRFGWKLKNFWAAKACPFVEVRIGPITKKVFYSESGNAIEQLINYLKNE